MLVICHLQVYKEKAKSDSVTTLTSFCCAYYAESFPCVPPKKKKPECSDEGTNCLNQHTSSTETGRMAVLII